MNNHLKNKDRIVKLFIPIAILGIVGLAVFYSFLNKNSKNGEQFVGISGLSSQEISFLADQGFVPAIQGEKEELTIADLKSPGLVEQNLNSPEESFEVLATKLDKTSYQMAFKLENKSNQSKEFYLIPISKDSQAEFQEIKGAINNKNLLSINKEDVKKEPLESLYDIQQHKKELNPELAKAYDDIDNNNYQAKPIKITLAPNSTLLAKSNWNINGNNDIKSIYFLIYGSAGGARDEIADLGNYVEAGTTLANKDTSGTFQAKDNEIELISERTRSFKKFRLPNAPDNRARYRIGGQIGPIHYKLDPFNENEVYKEIDLTVHLTPDKPWYAAMETNGYQVRFWQEKQEDGGILRYVAEFRRAGKWLRMAPTALFYENAAGEKQIISQLVQGIVPTIDNNNYQITWTNAFGPGIDFRYNVGASEFFKTVVIRDQASLPAPTINSAGLKLTVVMSVAWSNEVKPSSNFAQSITPSALSSEAIGPVDEKLNNPTEFSFKDANNQDIWWWQEPKAWDSSEERNIILAESQLTRQGNKVYNAISVPVAVFSNAQTKFPYYVDTAITQEQVGASLDDGGNYGATFPGDGNAYLGSLQVTLGAATTPSYFIAAFRFLAVPIAQGSTIDSASTTVMANLTYALNNNSIDVDFWSEAVDDAVALATTTHEPYDVYVAKAANSATWTTSAAWTAGEWYESSDLSVPVQDWVSRAGMISGNDLMLVSAHGGAQPPAASARRQVKTWDVTGNVSGAKFDCTYTEPTPPTGVRIKGTNLRVKGGLRIKF